MNAKYDMNQKIPPTCWILENISEISYQSHHSIILSPPSIDAKFWKINQKYFYVQNFWKLEKKISKKNNDNDCKLFSNFVKTIVNFAYKILVCLIDLEWHRLLNLAGISQGMFHHDQPSILVSFMFLFNYFFSNFLSLSWWFVVISCTCALFGMFVKK